MISRPKLKPELERYERYLDGYRLDYEHFEVIDIIPQDNEFAATIMHDIRPDAVKPWCVKCPPMSRQKFRSLS